MKKTDIKKTTDLVLWFLFCFILGTGLMIHYRLVPGVQGGSGLTLLGMGRHGWGTLHFWTSCLFIVVLSGHLYLNMNVVKALIADGSNRKTAVLFSIGILIVIFFLVFPVFQGQGGYGKNGIYHRGQQSGHLFR